jgi:hypothetical protein
MVPSNAALKGSLFQQVIPGVPPAIFSRSGGNAGAWDIDDDGRLDDRSHDARPNLRVLPADIPGKAAQSWLSCRPWFSPRRERSFHTDALHPGCMPAVPHRCPGRLHRPANKQVHRQTMQARKPTGKYACSYLRFESDPAHGNFAMHSASRSRYGIASKWRIKPNVCPTDATTLFTTFRLLPRGIDSRTLSVVRPGTRYAVSLQPGPLLFA